MPRLRDPDSLKDVCAHFRAILGPRAAEIIGRSQSVLHKAADPDDDYMLTTNQMLALDEACAILTGAAPFLDYQQRRAGAARAKQVEPVGIAVLDAEVAMGRLAESLRRATAADGAMGEKLTQNEACDIKQSVVRVMNELQDILNSISAVSGPVPKKARRK